MNRINSVYQNPINTNYKYSANITSPSFKGKYRFAETTVDTAVRNRGTILKGIVGFLGSLGLIKIAKNIGKTQEEVQVTETKPNYNEPVQAQEVNPEPQIQEKEAPIQAQESVKYVTGKDLLNKVEEFVNAEYDKTVADAKNKFEEAKKAAEEKRDAAYADAKVEYQKEYDDLCLKTIGKKSKDLKRSAYFEYKNRFHSQGMLGKAYNEYENIWSGGMLAKAYDEYENVWSGGMLAKAFGKYYHNIITEEEYKKIEAEAKAKFETIKNEAKTKYQEIEAKADSKYNDTIARSDALEQKRDNRLNKIKDDFNTMIESAKKERDNAIKEAKEKRDIIRAEYVKINTGATETPMPEKEALKAAKTQARKIEKAQALEKAKREKKIAEKAAKAKEMAAELEKSGFINIKELSNGSLQFEYQGAKYTISNKEGQNANLYKSMLRGVQDGSLTKGTSVRALSDGKSYKCDWLFNSQQASVETLLNFVNSSEIAQNNTYFTSKIDSILNSLTNEEINAYIDKYQSAILATEKGKKYIKELKSSDPKRYIEIITPKALFERIEGREYLKTHNRGEYETRIKRLYNQSRLSAKEKQIVENELNCMNEEELYKFIDNYPTLAITTNMGQQALLRLKTQNPVQYAKLLKAEKIFQTTEGKNFLNDNEHDVYVILKQQNEIKRQKYENQSDEAPYPDYDSPRNREIWEKEQRKRESSSSYRGTRYFTNGAEEAAAERRRKAEEEKERQRKMERDLGISYISHDGTTHRIGYRDKILEEVVTDNGTFYRPAYTTQKLYTNIEDAYKAS